MISACGMACDVCMLREKCGGCCPGTDPKAPERYKKLEAMGLPCPILKCAIERKQDHCLRCPEFPCRTHYDAGIPYSTKLLDLFKKFKEGR